LIGLSIAPSASGAMNVKPKGERLRSDLCSPSLFYQTFDDFAGRKQRPPVLAVKLGDGFGRAR
jgi:hypothetical protein